MSRVHIVALSFSIRDRCTRAGPPGSSVDPGILPLNVCQWRAICHVPTTECIQGASVIVPALSVVVACRAHLPLKNMMVYVLEALYMSQVPPCMRCNLPSVQSRV